MSGQGEKPRPSGRGAVTPTKQPLPGIPTGRIIGQDRCENCKFSHPSPAHQGQLECHRNPPAATVFMVPTGRNGQHGFVTHSAFPLVKPEMSCGEHRPKIEKVN